MLDRHFNKTMEKCANCSTINEQSNYLWVLPDIVIIKPHREPHYKNLPIDYPLQDLNLAQYLHPESPDNDKKIITLYSLYGIVVSNFPSLYPLFFSFNFKLICSVVVIFPTTSLIVETKVLSALKNYKF
uniref:Uncharacterized protein n=1 Tax=Meloidogyne enterolobii TaxID=390850 RepID=A0A6V7WAA2_MELEN|nr:unnamed protein product [Meloidogyne enterolobii]